MANNQNPFSAFFQDNTGVFIPTTNVWDLHFTNSRTLDHDKQLKEILIKLYENLNQIALSLNIKDSGKYVSFEFLNGQTFKNEGIQVFRKIILCGTLPDNNTIKIPHYINPGNSYSFTRIYGCATDPISLNYIPLPFTSSTGTGQVELYVNSTDVVLVTSATFSNYTTTYVILEYIKE